MSGITSARHNGGRDITHLQWVELSNPAKYPVVHGSTTTKNHSAPNVNSAEVETSSQLYNIS